MSPAARILVGIVLAFAIYCGTDPFKQGAISEFPEFEALKVDMPEWSQVPPEKDVDNLLQNSEIKFLNQVQGPESMAFDPKGRGPYTGVADGRILFWNGTSWLHFASTSSNRSELCDPKSSHISYLKNEHICGRALGLRFDKKTGDLYIADAYLGLMKVGPQGGLATSLATEAEGVPLRFTNDLDIDEDGNIYFTDSSNKYQRRNFMQLVFSADNSGRVLKYNLNTKETSVLLRNLQFPNGLSLSKDGSFFVLCEGAIGRLRKYWLKGEKAGTTEVMAILPGFPDNVRTNEKGDFWVAIHCRRSLYTYFCALHPKIRTLLLKLPIPAKIQYLILNKLTVDKGLIEVFARDIDKDTLVLYAARASRVKNQDAIDASIVNMLGDPKEARAGIKELHVLPFNLVDKRTAITYTLVIFKHLNTLLLLNLVSVSR